MSEDEESQVDPEEESKPRKWWLGTTMGGKPSFVEIVKVNDIDIGLDEDAPPKIVRDDVMVIDRGVFLGQVTQANGMAGLGFTDIREVFGPTLMPSDYDLSKKSARTPLTIQGHSLLFGPYLWLQHNSPENQDVWEQIGFIYSPITQEERERSAQKKPTPKGAGAQPVNPGNTPGALGAIGGIKP